MTYLLEEVPHSQNGAHHYAHQIIGRKSIIDEVIFLLFVSTKEMQVVCLEGH